MKNEIKEIIAERIKYNSSKEKYGYFIANSCIDICASDILEDVKKAGYRKQSETVNMKVIFAKHKDTKEYLFKVPSHIKKIKKGDILAVNTMKGLSLAIATTEIQDCSELIAEKLGAYLPLKEVYCIVTDELLRLCQNANEKELGIIPF